MKVIERIRSDVNSRSLWKCRCKCGKECIVLVTNLTASIDRIEIQSILFYRNVSSCDKQ